MAGQSFPEKRVSVKSTPPACRAIRIVSARPAPSKYKSSCFVEDDMVLDLIYFVVENDLWSVGLFRL